MLVCVWLCLQAQEGNINFTELAERVEYGNYEIVLFDISNSMKPYPLLLVRKYR